MMKNKIAIWQRVLEFYGTGHLILHFFHSHYKCRAWYLLPYFMNLNKCSINPVAIEDSTVSITTANDSLAQRIKPIPISEPYPVLCEYISLFDLSYWSRDTVVKLQIGSDSFCLWCFQSNLIISCWV